MHLPDPTFLSLWLMSVLAGGVITFVLFTLLFPRSTALSIFGLISGCLVGVVVPPGMMVIEFVMDDLTESGAQDYTRVKNLMQRDCRLVEIGRKILQDGSMTRGEYSQFMSKTSNLELSDARAEAVGTPAKQCPTDRESRPRQ